MLKTLDGKILEVETAAALGWLPVKEMVISAGTDAGFFSLPNVTAQIMSKVIKYCKKHANPSGDGRTDFDTDFLRVDHDTLFDLILAANYLNIRSLLDLTRQPLADMIKGKTLEVVRKMFIIKSDFNPNEEEDGVASTSGRSSEKKSALALSKCDRSRF